MAFFHGSQLTTKPPPTVPLCGACGLYKGCESPKMRVTGQGRKKWLVVAEAPDEDEDEEGKPFVGESGKFLRRRLANMGVDLDKDCWKTNALICRPPSGREPTSKEVGYCRPNIITTIKKLKPEVILLLGGAAVRSVVGHTWKDSVGPIKRWVGWQIPDTKLNAWICPTWHPSYLIKNDRDRALHLWFDKHLEAATELEGRPWDDIPNYKKHIDCLLDTDVAAGVLDSLPRNEGVLAFDYETNMLKPDNDNAQIICCAVSWGGRSNTEAPITTISYPWHGKASKAIEATGRLLKSKVPKIASNLKFEERWTKKEFGHGVRNWAFDTMQAAHILDNRPGITSIKFQQYIHLGMPAYNTHLDKYLKSPSAQTPNQIKEIAVDDLLLYCGLDAVLEYRVAMIQARLLGISLQGK